MVLAEANPLATPIDAYLWKSLGDIATKKDWTCHNKPKSGDNVITGKC
jgi:hypothetical protein|tara:strand:+ start:6813 stop:6956 length:144 start_codon:yes stop_codon:yes gene_type:complete